MLKKAASKLETAFNLSSARPFYAIRPLDASFFDSVKAILINTFAIGKTVKFFLGFLILQKTSDFSELLYRILDSHHINSDQFIWIFLIRTDLDRLAWPYYNGFFPPFLLQNIFHLAVIKLPLLSRAEIRLG